MRLPFTLSAPASSANLGSGFDAVAVALDVRMRVHVRAADGAPSFAFRGTEQPTHDGLRTLFVRAMERGAAGALPPLDITVDNAIPLGAGLGSSAAARALGIAAGALVTGAATTRGLPAYVAPLASDLEGHVDNALAATYGGIAIGVGAAPGSFATVAAPVNLVADIVTPRVTHSTHEARSLLPASYTRADAVQNVGCAALLGAALASGSWTMLRTAMRDRLHQPYRAQIYPWLDATIAGAQALDGVYAAALSGAGPSILAFADPATAIDDVHRTLCAPIVAAGIAIAHVRRVTIAAAGIRVESWSV